MKIKILISFFIFSAAIITAADTNVFDLNHEAELHLVEGDYFIAIEKYKTVLEINPNYINAVKGLAEAYYFLGEYEEAYRQIKTARRFDMHNIELLSMEGRILLGLGNLEEARKIFALIKQREPYNINAYFGFAEIALITGNYSESFSNYNNILSISPSNRKALLSLVLLAAYRGNISDAEKYLGQAIRLYPDDYFARYVAARYYLKTGNLLQAENSIRTSLSLNPDYIDSALLYSDILLYAGKYEQVPGVLESFYRKRNNSLVPYTLGKAYEKQGDFDTALRLYADAFRINPDNEIARYSLENIIRFQKDFSDPIRSRYADYHFNMSRGFEERNYIQKAVNSCRRGLVIDPYSVKGRLQYAEIFKKMGFNAKYLYELMTLPENERNKQRISDLIEITESIVENNLASRWGIDQFLINKNSYKINIFYIDEMNMLHPLGDETVTEVLVSILNHNENISILNNNRKIENYAQAFSRSRSSGIQSDYFFILKYSESERIFNITASLYSSYTGALIREYRVSRSGNLRIWEGLNRLAENILSDTGITGEIIRLDFDKGIINLGKFENISNNDTFTIVRKNGLKPDRSSLGYVYDESDILGSFTVTEIDETISAGTIKNKTLFSMVNHGDIVVPPDKTEPAPAGIEPGSAVPALNIYDLILEIR